MPDAITWSKVSVYMDLLRTLRQIEGKEPWDGDGAGWPEEACSGGCMMDGQGHACVSTMAVASTMGVSAHEPPDLGVSPQGPFVGDVSVADSSVALAVRRAICELYRTMSTDEAIRTTELTCLSRPSSDA